MKEKKSDQFCSQCTDKSRDILSRRNKLNCRIIETREKFIPFIDQDYRQFSTTNVFARLYKCYDVDKMI